MNKIVILLIKLPSQLKIHKIFKKEFKILLILFHKIKLKIKLVKLLKKEIMKVLKVLDMIGYFYKLLLKLINIVNY